MVIMSFSGCAKITCPLRWLLLLLGSECWLQKIVLLPPSPWQTGPGDTQPQWPHSYLQGQEKKGGKY